jgi:hypothetical protein
VKVYIKEFDVEMELKNNGVELDVSDPQGNHIGDLIVTKTKLIWCQGRIRGKNGKPILWEDFIAYMNGRP